MAQQLDLFGPGSPDPVPLTPSAPAVNARGRLLAARGALATEALLLSEIEALFAAAERDPALLARPVRIVVPSKSLRLHVASAIVRHRRRGTAGLIVQTLHALALEVLEHSGEPAGSGGGALFEILARRAARAQPALFRGLDDLIEGYGAAASTIRDLLDAGLDPAHAGALDELLSSEGKAVATAMDLERARALVRAAAAAQSEMERLGTGRLADLLRRATQVLLSRPEALPARAVIVHGFADATGLASDLIEGLVRSRDATVLIDRPPDPSFQTIGASGTGEVRLERAFSDRWAERVALATGPAVLRGPEPVPPRREAFIASGTDAEVREAALRLRALLDAGVAPERLGVVARDLGPYRFAVRRHFERLGLPYSGLAATGGKTPMGRRLAALEDLLRRGGDTPVSRWLDAAIRLPGAAGRPGFELRLAFAALGAGRLRDAAEIDLSGLLDPWGKYSLPIRQGFSAGTERDPEPEGVDEGEGLEPVPEEPAAPEGETGPSAETGTGIRAPRRRISGERLGAAIAAAKRAGEKLENWPAAAPAAVHLERLRSLLAGDLGWSPKDGGSGGEAIPAEEIARAFAALAALAGELPGDFPLTKEELGALVSEAFSRLGTGGFGGNGGAGVQVLSVTEARGRTFEHLFVLGLARDAFPRPVREDPLLPDSLRRVLRRLLPDLAEKRAGFDEERHLFAQLLSASAQVTLSWQSADDDGRPRAASPLVERIVFEAGGVARAPGLFAAADPALPAGPRSAALLRPAWEHSTLAALHGSRSEFAEVLPAALAELAPEIGATRPEATATARLAALSELDPDLRTPEGRAANHRLGPWFGFVGTLGAPGTGPRTEELDPRRRELAVTHLERLDGCPWQFFLSRLLAIEPTPDPLQALPGLDARLLGNLIHAVLDRLAKRPGSSAVWPEDEAIEPILREEAAKMVAVEGIALSGLGRALAERARPYLAAAREPWGNELIRTEVKGSVEVVDPATGGPRTLAFRADREDRLPDGAPLFTDWKTGRPLSLKKRPETRRADLVAKIASGALLQAVAYRRSAGPGALGRYYYLKPEAEVREFAVEADSEIDAAFDRAVSAGLAAHAAGSFFPRLVDPAGQREPRRCDYCEVAEACLRGDSGARRRLFEWSARGEAENATDRALLGVWKLAATEPRGEGP